MGTRSTHIFFSPSVTAVERFPMVTSAGRKKQLEVLLPTVLFFGNADFSMGNKIVNPTALPPAKGEHKERL